MAFKNGGYQDVHVDECELRDLPETIADEKPTEQNIGSIIEHPPTRSWTMSHSWRSSLYSKILFHGLSISVICGLVIAAVCISLTSITNNGLTACSISGEFNIVPLLYSQGDDYNYQPWAKDETFTINLSFGPLLFAKAKIIDVAWDLVVGRGGQAVLALLSYYGFNQALTRIMEAGPVSHDTFEAISLQSGTLLAVIKVIKDFHTNQGIRARAIITWIIVSSSIVLVFPTLASAMTGYTASFDAFVQDSSGGKLAVNDFQPVFYIIHDGSRLGDGFHDEYPVYDIDPGNPMGTIFDCRGDAKNGVTATWRENCRKTWLSSCSSSAPGEMDAATKQIKVNWKPAPEKCDLLWRVSEYTYNYGFRGLRNHSSIFRINRAGLEIAIASPTLNITTHMENRWGLYGLQIMSRPDSPDDSGWSILPYGNDWDKSTEDGRLGDKFGAGGSGISYGRFYNNQSSRIFSSIDFANGTCQLPVGNNAESGPATYRWGFSLQLLVVCLLLLLFWTVGMYALYLDAHLHVNQSMLRRSMGTKRAVIDLSIEYSKHIDSSATLMCTNTQLEKAIGNPTISYVDLAAQNPITMTRWQYFMRVKHGKRWLWASPLLFFLIAGIVTGVVMGVLILRSY